MMAAKKQKLDFEQSMQALETIVKKLEAGDLSLEESIQCFEEGVNLSWHCQEALNKAEQRVSILMKENETYQLKSFEDKTEE